MAFRQIPNIFKIAASDTPQPMIGSWISAIVTGSLTGEQFSPITLTLGTELNSGNDASLFFVGEPAWLINADGTNGETVRIQSISGNNITLGPQTNTSNKGGQNPVTMFNHFAGAIGTGSFLLPKYMANNVLVMFEDGGTGPFLYIGCRPIMTNVAYRVFKLAATSTGVSPAFWNAGEFSPGNPIDISELFVYDANAGDTYCVSIMVD